MSLDKLILFQNCVPVMGAKNCLICDLQKHSFISISKELYNFISNYNNKSIDYIIKNEGKKGEDKINFLIKNNLAFIEKDHNNFPPINFRFNYPFQISNSIITVTEKIDVFDVIQQLDNLNCKNVEFIILENSLINIKKINEFINKGKFIISSIGFIVNYERGITKNKISKLLLKYPRISFFIIGNYKENDFLEPVRENNMGYALFSKSKYNNEKLCGNISPDYFICNMKLFSETKVYNSCLNKKISIDVAGNIKNCPSMIQNFGNIENTTLEEALQHKDFKKYWNLTKDNIEVCKDCEFRYICTDCRAYTERSHTDNNGLDISKPLKCGYNPYIGEWEEWSTNPLKEKAIQFYGMQELIKK